MRNMKGVQRLRINEKEILLMDYSNGNEADMIALATELTEIALAEKQMILVLAIFNENNFVTPKILQQLERLTAQVIHLIDKAALIGLGPTKKLILQGYNLLFNRNFRAFNTRQEAIAYLVDQNSA